MQQTYNINNKEINFGKNSLIYGILGIVFLFVPLGFLSLTSIIFGILAIYDGNKVRKYDMCGLAGFILGIIQVVLYLVILALSLVLISLISSLY